MKAIRWSAHALKNLADREIDKSDADQVISSPNRVIAQPSGRQILVRRYNDSKLGQEMALCVVIEESDKEAIVITVFKTSQLKKYLEGTQP